MVHNIKFWNKISPGWQRNEPALGLASPEGGVGLNLGAVGGEVGQKERNYPG